MGIILRPEGVQVPRERRSHYSCLGVLQGSGEHNFKPLYTLEYLALDKLLVSESSFSA